MNTIKTMIIMLILASLLYSYNSKDINNFYNAYYSSSYNIKTIENNNSQTYKNIYSLIKAKTMTNDKEKYNYLKEAINQNKDKRI